MPRIARDARLDTRTARAKFAPRREPYWRSIVEGLAVGYRRGKRGGSWLARAYSQDTGRSYAALGAADDTTEADGVAVLTFTEAQERARAWFADRMRAAAGLEPLGAGPYSVGSALDDYLAHYRRKGGKAAQATEAAIEAHIRPALGGLPVAALSPRKLADWHHALAEQPVRRRRKSLPAARAAAKAAPAKSAGQPDPEALRRRRATANRVLTILKAALNHAFRDGKAASDTAWRRVRPFRSVDAPVIRYLSAEECRRLVNTCEPEFRALVQAALFTGCRYGELTRLCVADYNPEAGKVLVRASKAGKPRHVTLTEEGQRLFAQASIGKTGDALLFPRADGKAWGKSHQQRPLAEACQRAKIAPAISFHVLRHTHGSTLAMRGVPLPVIAEQLGHADTRMTQRHYAHLSPSYVADTIRASFPELGIVPEHPIVALQSG